MYFLLKASLLFSLMLVDTKIALGYGMRIKDEVSCQLHVIHIYIYKYVFIFIYSYIHLLVV